MADTCGPTDSSGSRLLAATTMVREERATSACRNATCAGLNCCVTTSTSGASSSPDAVRRLAGAQAFDRSAEDERCIGEAGGEQLRADLADDCTHADALARPPPSCARTDWWLPARVNTPASVATERTMASWVAGWSAHGANSGGRVRRIGKHTLHGGQHGDRRRRPGIPQQRCSDGGGEPQRAPDLGPARPAAAGQRTAQAVDRGAVGRDHPNEGQRVGDPAGRGRPGSRPRRAAHRGATRAPRERMPPTGSSCRTYPRRVTRLASPRWSERREVEQRRLQEQRLVRVSFERLEGVVDTRDRTRRRLGRAPSRPPARREMRRPSRRGRCGTRRCGIGATRACGDPRATCGRCRARPQQPHVRQARPPRRRARRQ